MPRALLAIMVITPRALRILKKIVSSFYYLKKKNLSRKQVARAKAKTFTIRQVPLFGSLLANYILSACRCAYVA
jgi:hypothetical protein